MRQLFMCVLSLSLSGALTGLVLFLIRPLTGKCFSKKWNYYIWLLLIARLLLPIHFGIWDGLWPAGNESMAGMAIEQQKTALSVTTEKKENFDWQPDFAETSDASDGTDLALPSESFASRRAAQWVHFPEPVMILAAIWLVGACLCFTIKITNYLRFSRRIQNGSREVADGRLLLLREDLCEKLHIKKQPVLRESLSVSGPITVGLLKPAVILPMDNFAEKSVGETDYNRQTLILHHELIHIRRRDLWYKWLYQLLLCIHWFNPVLYLAARRLNRDCELSCDEEVLRILTQDGKKAYGNLLIHAAERDLCVRSSMLSTTLLERKRDLKERLCGILQYKKQSGGRKAVAFCTALGLLFLSACGGIQAEPEAMPIRLSGDGAEKDVTGAFLAEDMGDSSQGESSQGDNSQGKNTQEKEEFPWVSFWGSLAERLFDYDVDDFLSSRMIVNKDGKAWKAYDDDELLAGKDISGQRSAFIYSGGGNRVSCSGLLLNGTESLRIVNVEEETRLQIESSFDLIEGRFKIIHVDPEGQVEVVNETGENSSGIITMKKGRNVIKMAGQGARLKKLEIRYSEQGMANAQSVYYSETEEYADRVLDEIKSGEVHKEELLDALIYMDEKDVSQALGLLLEQEIPLSEEEIYEFLIYSDAEQSGRYLADAVRNGKYKFTNEKYLPNLILYLDEEEAGELLMALMDGEEGMDFSLLKENVIYLDEEGQERCILHYLERGYTLTYSQFAEISPYLSERTIRKIDEKMEEK